MHFPAINLQKSNKLFTGLNSLEIPSMFLIYFEHSEEFWIKSLKTI